MYLALANLVMLLHGILVVCVLIGILLAITGKLRRYRVPERVFYILLCCVLTSQFAYGECIMTVWEKTLRNLALPGSAYHNSFIGHYLPWMPPVFYNVIGPLCLVLSLLALPFWRWQDYQLAKKSVVFACVRQRVQSVREQTSPEQKQSDQYSLRDANPKIGAMSVLKAHQAELNQQHEETGNTH